MTEKELRGLLRAIVLAAGPVPLAVGAQGCGGAVANSADRDASVMGTGGGAAQVGTSGSAGNGGHAGNGATAVDSGSGGSNSSFFGRAGPPSPSGSGGVPVFVGLMALPDASLNFTAPPLCQGWCTICERLPSDGIAAGADIADAGALSPSECKALCGVLATACSTFIYSSQRWVHCNVPCIGKGGRRPEGLTDASPSCDNPLASYFEGMARLEAASVPAFRILRRELALHGAPKKLRRSALAAARDEIRHARVTRDLARRYGGRYEPPRIEPRASRSIEAIAIENAVEGCVRETFGAMMATWQAAVATDPAVRKAMRRIARDETRHAALALRVGKWAERRLDAAGRLRVAAAKRAAVATIFDELEYDVVPVLETVAGVPSSARARLMAAALDAQLWS